MESETPADVRIFFKDKKNELKGPYTEREVQEWYRQNWFDSSFPFYFMKGNERPTEQTEFRTLDTLRTLNGIGCPFAPIEPESNSEKIEEKIAKLEKELVDLSKKCDGVKEMEKRLENVEKRLKELSTQPLISSSSVVVAASVSTKDAATVVKNAKKQPEENSEHARIANAWAAYYLDVLEAYKTGKWDGEKYKKNIATISPVLNEEAESLRQKCQDVLLKKLIELDYAYCSECDVIFHNHKHILMHVMCKTHNVQTDALRKLQKAVNDVMIALCGPLITSLKKSEDDQQAVLAKYAKVDSSSRGLRPLFDYVNNFTVVYGEFVSPYADSINAFRAEIVAKMIPRLKQNDRLGRKMMSELHEHIGDRQTRCFNCNVATGTREEYYQHLRTFAHMTKSNALELITLIVNMYKKE